MRATRLAHEQLAELLNQRSEAVAGGREQAYDWLHGELVKLAVRTATTSGGDT